MHKNNPKKLFALSISLPLVVSAASSKKSPAPSPSLAVVDGAGQKLGPVVHIEDPLFDTQGAYRRPGAPIAVDAAFQRDSRTYLLRFLTVEPYLDGTSRVFFESCDCSGPPLIRAEPTGQFGTLFTPSAIGGFHKLYLATESSESATRVTVCSLLTADTGCEPVSDGGGSSLMKRRASLVAMKCAVAG